MFDRISISFRKQYGPAETCDSVALFSRHLGRALVAHACRYLTELRIRQKASDAWSDPLAQLDPHTVMLDFVRWYTKDWDRLHDNLSLGRHEEDGDNSEHGHVVFDLDAWQYFEQKTGTAHPIQSDLPHEAMAHQTYKHARAR